MSAKYEVFIGKDHQYYFHLKATNGKIILVSEGYTQKANCLKGIRSVQATSKIANNFNKFMGKDKKFYFHLKQKKNGEIVGRSQGYKLMQSCNKGIMSVQNNATTTKIIHLTAKK